MPTTVSIHDIDLEGFVADTFPSAFPKASQGLIPSGAIFGRSWRNSDLGERHGHGMRGGTTDPMRELKRKNGATWAS